MQAIGIQHHQPSEEHKHQSEVDGYQIAHHRRQCNTVKSLLLLVEDGLQVPLMRLKGLGDIGKNKGVALVKLAQSLVVYAYLDISLLGRDDGSADARDDIVATLHSGFECLAALVEFCDGVADLAVGVDEEFDYGGEVATFLQVVVGIILLLEVVGELN